nr:MAG: DNA pilot protein [Microvirus sp.]
MFDPLSFGLSAVGGLISNLWTDERQDDAQKFNADQAQKQMDFQEKMSSTAYQRAMKDMRAAGLNPILAYQKGPASSPTGAMASTTFQQASDVLTPAVATAMQKTRLDQEIKNMIETNKNLGVQNLQMQALTDQARATQRNIDADTRIKTEMWHQAVREAEKSKTDEEFYSSPFGRVIRVLGTGLKELSPFISRGR